MRCIFRYALSKAYELFAASPLLFCTGLLVAAIANAELAADSQPTLTSDQTLWVQQPQVKNNPSPLLAKKQISTGDQPSDDSAEMLYRIEILVDELIRLKSLAKEQSVVLKKIIADRNKQRLEIATRLAEFGYVTSTDSVESLKAKKAQEEQTAYKAAFELASQQHFNEAIKLFQGFLADYPDGWLFADALFWIGEICLILSEPQIEQSLQAYMQLLQRFPKHQRVPAALYRLGHIHHQLGQNKKSKAFFARVIREYPESDAAQLASNYGR